MAESLVVVSELGKVLGIYPAPKRADVVVYDFCEGRRNLRPLIQARRTGFDARARCYAEKVRLQIFELADKVHLSDTRCVGDDAALLRPVLVVDKGRSPRLRFLDEFQEFYK